MEERELILLLKQGSKDAFTALYKQYWKQVYNFSRLYLTGADAAEEVVQEVFIKIWEMREFLREDDHFKGLLFIITRNQIFNRHRKNVNEDFYKSPRVYRPSDRRFASSPPWDFQFEP